MTAPHRRPHTSRPKVHRPNGITQEVTNLGWLIRALGQRTLERLDLHLHRVSGGWLWAEFADGTIYEAHFADATVMADWIDRRRNTQGVAVRLYDYGALWHDFTTWHVGEQAQPKPRQGQWLTHAYYTEVGA